MTRLCWVGWPAGAAFLTDIGAWTVFQLAIIGRFGTTDMAATGGVFRYLEVSFMPAVGIGMAVSTAVARPSARAARRWPGGSPGSVRPSMRLYEPDGSVVHHVRRSVDEVYQSGPCRHTTGTTLFVYAAVFQFFDAIAITHSCALRGAGDTMWASVVGAAQVWMILIGGGTLVAWLRPDLGSAGPWCFAAAFVICIGAHLVRTLALGSMGRLRCDRAKRAGSGVRRDSPDRVARVRVDLFRRMMNAER